MVSAMRASSTHRACSGTIEEVEGEVLLPFPARSKVEDNRRTVHVGQDGKLVFVSPQNLEGGGETEAGRRGWCDVLWLRVAQGNPLRGGAITVREERAARGVIGVLTLIVFMVRALNAGARLLDGLRRFAPRSTRLVAGGAVKAQEGWDEIQSSVLIRQSPGGPSLSRGGLRLRAYADVGDRASAWRLWGREEPGSMGRGAG